MQRNIFDLKEDWCLCPLDISGEWPDRRQAGKQKIGKYVLTSKN